MNPLTLKRLVIHTVAIAAGAGLALAVRPMLHGTAKEGSSTVSIVNEDSMKVDSPALRRAKRATPAQQTRENFQKSWSQLMARDMSPEMKREAGQLLLAKWAEVDLEGALSAAMEADRLDPGGKGIYLKAFEKAMRERPEDFLELLKSRAFGLDTALVRNQWVQVVGAAHPDFLAAHLEDLPPQSRPQAVSACLAAMDAEGRKGLLAKLMALPDTPENRGLWDAATQAMGEMPLDSLKEMLLSAEGTGERELARRGLGLAMAKIPHEEAKAVLESLPTNLRLEMAKQIIGSKKGGTGGIQAAADVLVESTEWSNMAINVAVALHNEGMKVKDPSAIAAWAIDLPERPDTEDLYRTAIRSYINRNRAEARAWIEEMPSGWKRDNALLDYAHQARLIGNQEESEWARLQVELPEFKTRGERDKTYWEEKQKREKALREE